MGSFIQVTVADFGVVTFYTHNAGNRNHESLVSLGQAVQVLEMGEYKRITKRRTALQVINRSGKGQ